MEAISLRSIKKESIKNIFNSITSTDKISRFEISRQTGLSLMTVGKVVDALLSIGVVKQEKEQSYTAGRKAGLISISTTHYAIVIDLTERNFTMSLIDISLRLSDSMTYTYNSSYYYDENLYIFLKNVATYISHRSDIENLIGIGVSVPGVYIAGEDKIISTKMPELNSINIKQIVEGILKRDVDIIIKNVEAAAISNVKLLQNYDNRVVIYMFMGDSVDGAVFNNGSIIKGAHGFECDFGNMILRFGESLEQRINRSVSDEMIANELSSAVYNIITILDPDTFIIESELSREPDFLINQIKESLVNSFGITAERMPEFRNGICDFRHSSRGIVIKLREKWLDNII